MSERERQRQREREREIETQRHRARDRERERAVGSSIQACLRVMHVFMLVHKMHLQTSSPCARRGYKQRHACSGVLRRSISAPLTSMPGKMQMSTRDRITVATMQIVMMRNRAQVASG